jgi:hypothetical protein
LSNNVTTSPLTLGGTSRCISTSQYAITIEMEVCHAMRQRVTHKAALLRPHSSMLKGGGAPTSAWTFHIGDLRNRTNTILLTNSPPPHHVIGLHPGTELRYFVVEQ